MDRNKVQNNTIRFINEYGISNDQLKKLIQNVKQKEIQKEINTIESLMKNEQNYTTEELVINRIILNENY